ncbi:hypothetical protein GV794_00515 [Nocardia cyriacigeorgica]|uniref:LppU protein n=1 Tax=Nocardia cyriacigeorgica TaxID=135487 RepID=A0A6P1D282_9NOCA|nr:hypothetical protein [Nocardia cyriacigeorgica]NEW38412.1 hypothetical protein [Nocardia cyriacigeorgica]NEW43624.1 hypothetical protein [Nocardia cyriacigeorgica]NEW49440.1 hypothetical protein [Nocardia cyriacigeorgica]NEW54156.1 hypothetical protein [Nocardia cyriacigeorgica]
MSGRSNLAHRALAACAVAATLVVPFAAGCSNSISGTAQPALDNAVSTTSSPESSSDSEPTSTRTPRSTTSTAPTGGTTSFEAEIGDCVTLGGTTTDAEIDKASCGSRAANYKVIGKVAKRSECVTDADSYYAETVNGVEQGALCLDIDWVVGGCMDVGGEDPKRVDCTEATIDGVKVLSIEKDADDANACGDGGSGYVYPERRFVVCVEEL